MSASPHAPTAGAPPAPSPLRRTHPPEPPTGPLQLLAPMKATRRAPPWRAWPWGSERVPGKAWGLLRAPRALWSPQQVRVKPVTTQPPALKGLGEPRVQLERVRVTAALGSMAARHWQPVGRRTPPLQRVPARSPPEAGMMYRPGPVERRPAGRECRYGCPPARAEAGHQTTAASR